MIQARAAWKMAWMRVTEVEKVASSSILDMEGRADRIS